MYDDSNPSVNNVTFLENGQLVSSGMVRETVFQKWKKIRLF